MGRSETSWSSVTGSKPESKPPSFNPQGLAKEDWVTVWFFGLNVNRTISPGLAYYTAYLSVTRNTDTVVDR